MQQTTQMCRSKQAQAQEIVDVCWKTRLLSKWGKHVTVDKERKTFNRFQALGNVQPFAMAGNVTSDKRGKTQQCDCF